MAEEDSQEKKAKRRLRVNTETVRERNEKLQLQLSSPRRPNRLGAFIGGFFWPLRSLGRQIAKLGRFRVFRWIGYVLLPPYIRSSWRELKLVQWPTMRQTIQLTYAVIIFSVVFGLIVYGVDSVLDKAFKELIV